jgi:hypothetical protein
MINNHFFLLHGGLPSGQATPFGNEDDDTKIIKKITNEVTIDKTL